MKVLAREKTGDVLLSEAFNPSSEGRQHHFQPSVLLLRRCRLSSIFPPPVTQKPLRFPSIALVSTCRVPFSRAHKFKGLIGNPT